MQNIPPTIFDNGHVVKSSKEDDNTKSTIFDNGADVPLNESGYGFDFGDNIKEPGEQISEEPLPFNPVSQDDYKKELPLIDKHIDDLTQQIKKESRNPNAADIMAKSYQPEDMKERLNQMRQELYELQLKRGEYKRSIRDITPASRKEILGTKEAPITPKIRQEMLAKYGHDFVNQVERENKEAETDAHYKKRINSTYADPDLGYRSLKYSENIDYPSLESQHKYNKFLNDLRDQEEYVNSDFWKKESLVKKSLKKYVDANFEPEQREAEYKKALNHANKKLITDDNGELTLHGLKSVASHKQGMLMVEKADIESQIKEIDPRSYQIIPGIVNQPVGGMTGMQQANQLNSLKNELDQLNTAIAATDKILKIPEYYRKGFKGIGQGMLSVPLRELKGMGFEGLMDAANVLTIDKKIQNGEELTFAEKNSLELYATLQNAAGKGRYSTAEQLGAGVTRMLPYVVSFAATGGIYNTVSKGTTKAVTSKLTNLGVKKVINVKNPIMHKALGLSKDVTSISMAELGAKNMGRIVGTIAQSTAMPQMYGKGTIDRITKDAMPLLLDESSNELIVALDAGSEESFGKAFGKSGWETFSEVFTERLGTHIMNVGKAGGVAIKGKKKAADAAKKYMISKWMQSQGIKTTKEALKKVQKVSGWNGIAEEYLEEVANGIMGGAFTENKFIGDKTWKEWSNEQLVTLGTVALFGGGVKIATSPLRAMTIGRNEVYKGKDKDGKEVTIKMPKTIHKEITNILEADGLIDGDALQAVLDKYDHKLTKPQANLIIDLALEAGRNKNIEDSEPSIAKAKAKQKAAEAKASVRATTETTPTDAPLLSTESPFGEITGAEYDITDEDQITGTNQEEGKIELTAEEVKEIEEVNNEISLQFPELADAGLLTTNEVGQYEEPTIPSLLIKRQELKNSLEQENVIYDQYGNITNPSPEVNLLQDKLDIIDSELRTLQFAGEKSFNNLKPSEKHSVLKQELRGNNVLSGTIARQGNTRQMIRLSDGRIIYSFTGRSKSLGESDKQFEARKRNLDAAIAEDKPVILKIVPKAEWNPNDEAAIESVDRNGDKVRVPYGDRVDVISDGKVIAYVEESDFFDNQKRDKLAKQAEEKINKLAAEVESKKEKIEKEKIEPTNDSIEAKKADIKKRRKEEIKRIDDEVKKREPRGNGITYNMLNRIDAKYDAELEKLEKKEKIKGLAGEVAEEIVKRAGGLKQALSNQEKKDLELKVKELVREVASLMKMNVTDAINFIIDKIRSLAISTESKVYMIAVLNTNKKAITKYIQKSLSKKATGPQVTAAEINFENPDSVTISGAQKVVSNLKTFNPLWRDIAKNTGSTRNQVEKAFWSMSKRKANHKIKNQADYLTFLELNRGQNIETDGIIDRLKDFPYTTIVSAFNFYSNVDLVRQVGLHVQDNQFKVRSLNPSKSYNEFRTMFYSNLAITGIESIKAQVADQAYQKNKRFSSYKDKSLTPQRREELRREQHASDITFLSKMTGLPENIWEQYFNSKTKETFAHTEDGTYKNFKTYDALLSEDTFLPNGQPKTQSTIVASLLFGRETTQKDRTSDEYKDIFTQFFLEGNEDKNVFSNLYKLVTSLTNTEEIGLDGIDVKGDRFSSFMQNNHMFTVIKNPMIDNRVTDFWKTEKPEIVMFNGLHNLDVNRFKDGTEALRLSTSDIFVGLLALFGEGGNSYQQNLGQFADKPNLYTVNVPKEEFTKDVGTDNFEEAVDFIYKMTLHSVPVFKEYFKEYKGNSPNDKLKNFIRHFLYNYGKNTNDLNEIIHSNFSSYGNDYVKMIKRAGSTVSPGYLPDRDIEGGVGENFRHAVVNEKAFFNKLGIELTGEVNDGQLFISGEFSKKMAVSMGDTYSKLDEYGGLLTTVKALWSGSVTGNNRGLTKGNLLNADVMAENFPDTDYSKIRDYMKEHEIDMLSFTSSTKIPEEGFDKVIPLFNDKGEMDINAPIPEGAIYSRTTEYLFIQQDLRHSTKPEPSKISSQFLTNAFSLPSGARIASMIYSMQDNALQKLKNEFNNLTEDEETIEWLKKNVDENSQEELYRLLELGLTPEDPTFRNLMKTIFSSAVSRKALEVKVNRVTQVEISDVNGILKSRRLTKDGKHVLLPEIAANIDGARSHDHQFKGKIDEAIAYVNDNKATYPDLFDNKGQLMEWEIVENDGIIPGEYIISTRTPADDLHSHTIARLAINIKYGNFTMLDKESQLPSGSDFDGDQRFNQVFYRNKDGNIILDESNEGLANRIMVEAAQDYMNPKNDAKIRSAINTSVYTKFVEKLRGNQKKFNPNDPRAFADIRKDNMVGVEMKGRMTDHMTGFSLAVKNQLKFKGDGVRIVYSENNVLSMRRVAFDNYNAIKAHMSVLLNLAFDNAKDPQIETMGLNEITINMFVLGIIGNDKLDSTKYNKFETHYEAVKKAIEKQSEYFKSELVTDFVNAMRSANGAMSNKEENDVFAAMLKEAETSDVGYSVEQVKNLRHFYSVSKELSDIRKLYSLTQKAPTTAIELVQAEKLVEKFRGTNKENRFRFINPNAFFVDNKFVTEFAIIDKVISFSKNYIFHASIEFSQPAREIVSFVDRMLKSADSKSKLSRVQLEGIFRSINSIANIRSINPTQVNFKQFEKELIARIREMKADDPMNDFLQYIQRVIRKGVASLEINPELRFSTIPEDVMVNVKKAFAALPEDLKEDLALYNYQKFGSSLMTSNGGFLSLFDDAFRVKLSEKATDEIFDNWIHDRLTAAEKYNIARWVVRLHRDKDIKAFDQTNDRAGIYSPAAVATVEKPISKEGLEALSTLLTPDDYVSWEEAHGSIELREWLMKNIGKSIKKDLTPFAKKKISSINEISSREFSAGINDNERTKDLLDNTDQIINTQDPELQEFIYDKLAKVYPGVNFFTDRQSFYDFAQRNGLRMMTVDTSAIGHAFKNAAFVDPNSDRQDAMIHEYAHIYWDALPKDYYVKKQLMRLYREKMGDLYSEKDIEERIILDIGLHGADMAKAELLGINQSKFKELIQKFWNAVKRLLGTLKQPDLINMMATNVWSNRHDINPSTPEGQFQIKNLIEYNPVQDNIIFDEEPHTYTYGGKLFESVTKVISTFKNQKFDPTKFAERRLEQFKKEYKRENYGKELRPDFAQMEYESLRDFGEDAARTGTAIHAVGEEVFSGKMMNEELKSSFFTIEGSNNTYSQLVNSFNDLKEKILEKYPEAKFFTEHKVISEKYKIAGSIDLLVEVGKNEVILFDFKTTAEPFVKADGTFMDKYITPYGYMKPPFQTVKESKHVSHVLQLSTYASIVEEQKNESNPKEKNKVIGTYIVPVLRELTKGGLVKSASLASEVVDEDGNVDIWGNLVPIKWRNKDGKKSKINSDTVTRMMAINVQHRRDSDKFSDQYKAILEKDRSLTPAIRKDMLSAYNYFRQMGITKLSEASYNNMEDIQGNGLREITGLLSHLDYTLNDMNGAIPFEHLFFAAKQGITKADYIENFDTHFPEMIVGHRWKLKKNPNLSREENDRRWYHEELGGEDVYFHEVGANDLKESDEIIQIYHTEGHRKNVYEDYQRLTVKHVDYRSNFILAENELKEEVRIPSIGPGEGFHKILDKAPLSQRGVTKNNYVPRYLNEKEDILERHYYTMDVSAQKLFERFSDSSRREQAQRDLMKQIFKFFNSISNINQMREFMDNESMVEDLYIKVSSELEDFQKANITDEWLSPAKTVSMFLRDTLMNYAIAEYIAKENTNDIPEKVMPITLNYWYMLTNNRESVAIDFRGWTTQTLATNTPLRMFSGRYIGFNAFKLGYTESNISIAEEQFEFSEKMNELMKNSSIDIRNITTQYIDSKFYKKPEAKGLSTDEKALLDLIYEYYYKYDTYYQNKRTQQIKDGGSKIDYPVPVRVSRMYAVKSEFQEQKKYGRKWGRRFHEALQPSKYDNVEIHQIDIEEYKKSGIIKKDYKLPKTTFRDIKIEFVADEAGVAGENIVRRRQLWLGKGWQRMALRVPGMRVVATPGLLYEYRKLAKEAYVKSTNKRHISSLGRYDVIMESQYILEGEEKAILSMISKTNMQHNIAPLDAFMDMYTQDYTAGRYIKRLTDIVMFNDTGIDGWGADLGKFLIKAVSLNSIIFRVGIQKLNLMIGVGSNILREPAAFAKGFTRIFGGNAPDNLTGNLAYKFFLKVMPNFIKGYNIIKRHGIAGMSSDSKFDALAEEINLKVFKLKSKVSESTILTWGYSIMEAVERFIQFPLLIGMMTAEEWNAYDVHANIVNPSNSLDVTRKRQLMNRTSDIHGDYNRATTAPAWLTGAGPFLLQFKKWFPTSAKFVGGTHTISDEFNIKSGIIASIKLYSKLFVYNNSSVAKRQERAAVYLEKLDSETEETEILNQKFFNTTSQYYEILVAEFNGGKIKIKELSRSDRMNLMSIGIMMTSAALIFFVRAMFWGDDDEFKKKLASDKVKDYWDLMSRFSGGLMPAANPDEIIRMVENPIAAVNYCVNGWRFFSTLNQEYTEYTPLTYPGMKKRVLAVTYLMPAGAAIRDYSESAVKMYRNNKDFDWGLLGVDPADVTPKMEKSTMGLSFQDFLDKAQKGRVFSQVINNYKMSLALEGKSEKEQDAIIDMYTMQSKVKKAKNDLEYALEFANLEQLYKEGKIDFKDMISRADEIKAKLKESAKLTVKELQDRNTKDDSKDRYEERPKGITSGKLKINN